MKRIGNIFQTLISYDNLLQAHKEARKGKAKYRQVRLFEKDLHNNLLKLHKSLLNGLWDVFGYRHFITHDGQKQRIVDWDPCYIDNIVQHAILHTAGRILLSSMITDTYAGIRKRGIHKCVTRLKKFIKSYNTDQPVYVLKLDIHKFYQSVDISILKKKIRNKIKDHSVLDLLDKILDSHPDGLPIGSYLSQLLSNFYLSLLDHFIKNKGIKHYVRYCDDIVILNSSKHLLKRLLTLITDLCQKLNIKIKPGCQIFPILRYGIDFLGYVFTRNRIKLRKSIERRFRRVASRYNKTKEGIKSLASYYGWLKWLSNGLRLWDSILHKSFKQLVQE